MTLLNTNVNTDEGVIHITYSDLNGDTKVFSTQFVQDAEEFVKTLSK